jgi:flagellar biosynthesis protein FlhB
MPDKSQQTEKPTPRRLEKARREGQFPVSRDFVSAVQFATFTWILSAWSGEALDGVRQLLRLLFTHAFAMASAGADLGVAECRRLFLTATGRVLAPLLLAGGGLVAAGVAAHLAVTGLGLAGKRLTPDFTRLNPGPRIKDLRRQNTSYFVQAVLFLPLFLGIVYWIARGELAQLLRLPLETVPSGIRQVAASIDNLLWKAAGALLAWGAIDLYRQKRRYQADLRMTKQEVREESKENEGNPQIKSRLRRLRRDVLRRRMMQEVPKATAVVVNPTHYAVALRYEMQKMAAPVVVAKGKNYLAARIRQRAIEHQVPIIENPPLAQTLYKSAEIGQEIPAALYRAVAEILAYILQMQRRAR